jgi:hypothetical protein
MLSATGNRDGSNKSGLRASGCLDLLNEQRHRVLQVFPIDPTEDSTQQCTRPATDKQAMPKGAPPWPVLAMPEWFVCSNVRSRDGGNGESKRHSFDTLKLNFRITLSA